MRAALSSFALAACAFGIAQAAETPAATRTTISVLAGGKEVAGIMLPVGVSGKFDIGADHIEPSSGSLHATGHVQLRLTIPNVAPMTLYGDELLITKETLSAEKAKAIEDLERMGASDQSIRASKDPSQLTDEDMARQQVIDEANMARLAQIIDRFGWPGLRFAGEEGARNAWAVLQHSDIANQRKYLPLLREAAARNDARAGDLALLEDRVRIQSGQPQLYGSQLKGGNPPELFPIEDEAHVDQRRRAVGLEPLADYVKHFGITYRPPAH